MGSISLVHGVTSDNFVKLGKSFIEANGKKGFIIALRRYPGLIVDDDNPFIPTPRQWGAWMAYWARLPYKTKAMRARGYATTPSEWPHEFDAMATVQGDHAASDAFERQWRDARESARFNAGNIAKQTSKALALWKQTRATQRQATPASHLDPTAGPVMDLSDFPDANSTPAELKAWEARQKERVA